MCRSVFFFFFFNDTTNTEIYTLSLHDALPICRAHGPAGEGRRRAAGRRRRGAPGGERARAPGRSEEHSSELQSLANLVCRLLLEKKKNQYTRPSFSLRYHHHMNLYTHSTTSLT